MRNLYTSSFAAVLGTISCGIPWISYAAGPQNLIDLANMLAKMFNAGATFLVFLAFIILFWSMVKNLLKRNGKLGEDTEYSRAIMWGITGLFVMVSIWGIISLLQQTLFGNNGSSNSSSQGSNAAPLSFPNNSTQ